MKYSLGGRERLHTDGFRSNDELELATPKDSVYERTVDGIQPGFSLFQVTQHSSAVVLFLLPSFFSLSTDSVLLHKLFLLPASTDNRLGALVILNAPVGREI